LNYWLLYERNDLPMEITRVSFASYNTPIAADGTLPVRLFGRKLNLKRLKTKQIKWLICYGLQDDLVEPETALAPLDHVDAQVTAFPKGHVAIATSWSHPGSAYALHMRYKKENAVGPVRFQLDLQDERDKAKKKTVAAGPKKALQPKAKAVGTKTGGTAGVKKSTKAKKTTQAKTSASAKGAAKPAVTAKTDTVK